MERIAALTGQERVNRYSTREEQAKRDIDGTRRRPRHLRLRHYRGPMETTELPPSVTVEPGPGGLAQVRVTSPLGIGTVRPTAPP